MNRRRFLQILAGTAAASTTAYFLPPIGGWKSDVILNPYEVKIESFPWPGISDELISYHKKLMDYCNLISGVSPLWEHC